MQPPHFLYNKISRLERGFGKAYNYANSALIAACEQASSWQTFGARERCRFHAFMGP